MGRTDADLLERLRRGAATGEVVQIETSETIPAAVLRQALVDGAETQLRWIALESATIEGRLDLDAATLACGLRASDCAFSDDIVLTDAHVPRLVLDGCRLPRLLAMGLHVAGSLSLERVEADLVNLTQAEIEGSLALKRARIGDDVDALAFCADRLRVTGPLTASKLTCRGEFRMLAADVGGQCRFAGASFSATDKAFAADRLVARGSIIFAQGAKIDGLLSLHGADIQGQLVLNEATFTYVGWPAVDLDGARLGAGLLCKDVTVDGGLSIGGAHVLGDVVISGGRFSAETGPALYGTRLRIRDDALIGGGPVFQGSIDLNGCAVGGLLGLTDTRITGTPGDAALSLDGASIEQDLVLETVTIGGKVTFIDADIGGQLAFRGTRVSVTDGAAISGDNADVRGLAVFKSGFVAQGRVRFLGARFASQLAFDDATLIAPGDIALDLERVQISASLYLRLAEIQGSLNLTDATVSAISDDASSWPRELNLTGLRYERLVADPEVTVQQRLSWLGRQPDRSSPQPYAMLAAAYRAAGLEEDARTVLIAARRQRRQDLRLPSRAWDRVLDVSIAYGYATWRALLGLVIFAALGVAVFSSQYPEHFTATKSGTAQPAFHAITYTLDVLVPVVSLRQRDAWTPDGYALWWSVGLTFLGWILTTAVVAALTGLLRRD